MNFSIMLELACVVAYITILFGGRVVRESGWKILAGLLTLVALGQVVAMALVVSQKYNVREKRGANICQAYLYDHDNRFFVGWEFDKSWVLCTVSWTVLIIDAAGVMGAALFLPKEDDYELIPEPQEHT